MKLMFDATIMAMSARSKTERTGIFFTAYRICRRLMENPAIELVFYCKKDEQYFLQRLEEFKSIPVYPLATPAEKFYQFCKWKKIAAKKEKRVFAKRLWYALGGAAKFLAYLPDLAVKLVCAKGDKCKLQNLGAFFSVFEPPAEEIDAIGGIAKYLYVHDTIPLTLDKLFCFDAMPKDYWFVRLVEYMKRTKGVHYFANSIATKNDFLKFIPNLRPGDLTVVPLACGEEFHPCTKEETLKALEKYGLPSDKKYVFSLCAIEPRKNLVRAVKTFVRFVEKNKIEDMVFILGGAHWDDFIGKLEYEISNLGEYKDKIIRAGYIDDEDLAPLYSGAEWFVYTSQYEGFGLPPLEAMACGCPVVTSNNSSLPEVVGEAGIMIDWDSDEQHIAAYEKYYNDRNFRKAMSAKGLERSKLFDWDKTTRAILEKMDVPVCKPASEKQ